MPVQFFSQENVPAPLLSGLSLIPPRSLNLFHEFLLFALANNVQKFLLSRFFTNHKLVMLLLKETLNLRIILKMDD